MNTIYIEESAYSYLREWAEKDRLKCSLAEPFFRKCEIRKKDNPECVLYVESKGFERKFSLKINKKLFAKVSFFLLLKLRTIFKFIIKSRKTLK